MVTDYKMIKAGVTQITWFEQQIKIAVENGWQPHGPFQLVVVDRQTVLIQPLILNGYSSIMEK